MNEPDFFDRTETKLRAGMRRGANLPWPLRVRKRVLALGRRSRGLAAVGVALVIAAPALAAAGVFSTGSTVPPSGRPVATAGNGVVVAAGAELTSLRVADPSGGLPWGLRLTRTTRGLVCLTVGRVRGTQIGALGIDHAFGNDGRFHPFSVNYSNAINCVTPDAQGYGFASDMWYGAPRAAYQGREGYCRVPWTPPAWIRAIRRRQHRKLPKASGPVCPANDVRDIYFGLLGPDATEIAYRTPDGHVHTEQAAGPQGAYLVVLPHNRHNDPSMGSTGQITSGTPIVGVAWRAGQNCGVLGPKHGKPFLGCRTHDYVAPTITAPNDDAVRSPLTVRKLARPGDLVSVSFTARVATTNARSFYAVELADAPHRDSNAPDDFTCGGGGGGRTSADVHVGERIKLTIGPAVQCYGIARGVVVLVIDHGPQTLPPVLLVPRSSRFKGRLNRLETVRIVGRFSYRIPRQP